jgi:NADP-dependent 3-hydroxy acid dehydrogenase YdfG
MGFCLTRSASEGQSSNLNIISNYPNLILGASGAKLMLAARREDRLKDLVAAIEKTGGTVAYRVTDVADRAQVQALADATLETYGRIDVLVNNAGLISASPLDQIKVDE